MLPRSIIFRIARNVADDLRSALEVEIARPEPMAPSRKEFEERLQFPEEIHRKGLISGRSRIEKRRDWDPLINRLTE